MLGIAGTAEAVYGDFAGKNGLSQGLLEAKYGSILSHKRICGLQEHGKRFLPEEEYAALVAKGIHFVSVEEELYPARLKNIPDPPCGIYVKGRLPAQDKLSVAIIGARECSEYGRYVGRELGSVLGKHGIQVISGMARGIDGIGQLAALEAGGTSFGVLGCGVDICYPQENRKLYQMLKMQGGVLSCFPPGTMPKSSLFPPRNRIVSGLADVIVVVEARQKSGTLITVDMALEQGREVYVVPGRLTDRLSDGCNRLGKLGAAILLSPEDFVADMQELFPQYFAASPAGSKVLEICDTTKKEGIGEEREPVQRLYDCLDVTPKTIEQIRKDAGEEMTYLQVQQQLMKMCLAGWIKQASPGFFFREKP